MKILLQVLVTENIVILIINALLEAYFLLADDLYVTCMHN